MHAVTILVGPHLVKVQRGTRIHGEDGNTVQSPTTIEETRNRNSYSRDIRKWRHIAQILERMEVSLGLSVALCLFIRR